MLMYTIYKDPTDYPGRVVLRVFDVQPGGTIPADTPAFVGDTVAEARSQVPAGLACFSRSPEDPTAVVETWL